VNTRVLVLNLLWLTRGVPNTGQEIFVLDTAFALIDGHWWLAKTLITTVDFGRVESTLQNQGATAVSGFGQ